MGREAAEESCGRPGATGRPNDAGRLRGDAARGAPGPAGEGLREVDGADPRRLSRGRAGRVHSTLRKRREGSPLLGDSQALPEPHGAGPGSAQTDVLPEVGRRRDRGARRGSAGLLPQLPRSGSPNRGPLRRLPSVKHRKKLIEVALPLEAINKASAREKSIRHGHPSTLHLWWARRPLAAARAVIFAQMVDDPSANPDLFPTEKKQEKERQRLFRLIEELVP